MGLNFNYRKRIRLGKGLGIYISKSGITPSYRNKKGSISTKGFSIRTGIPGLSYRKNFKKSSSSGCLVLLIIIVSFSVLNIFLFFNPI